VRCASYNKLTSQQTPVSQAPNARDVRRKATSHELRPLNEIKTVIEIPQELRGLLRRHISVRVECHDDVPGGVSNPSRRATPLPGAPCETTRISEGKCMAIATVASREFPSTSITSSMQSGMDSNTGSRLRAPLRAGTTRLARFLTDRHSVSEPDDRGTIADSKIDRVCVRVMVMPRRP
jgi:hypothetical protein